MHLMCQWYTITNFLERVRYISGTLRVKAFAKLDYLISEAGDRQFFERKRA